MTRATFLQEVRPMRVEALSARRHRRELTMAEAAEMLGGTARTFRRWRVRYDADGRLLPRVCPRESFPLLTRLRDAAYLSEGAYRGNAHDFPLR